jgi:hypothetical protein
MGCALLAAQPAKAAPEEIQVYMDEMDKPGHFGLDTHLNYVTDGTYTDDYPGQQQALHRLRITPNSPMASRPMSRLASICRWPHWMDRGGSIRAG